MSDSKQNRIVSHTEWKRTAPQYSSQETFIRLSFSKEDELRRVSHPLGSNKLKQMNILWWLFAAIWLVCAAYADNLWSLEFNIKIYIAPFG